MCAPVVIGMMALAAVSQAYSAKQSAKSQANLARFNAKVSRLSARDAMLRGEVAQHRQRQKTAILAGRQKSLIAAGGADVDLGSAADVIQSTLVLGEIDAMQAMNNAMREAWGFEVQATQFDFAGSAALRAGRTAVAVSLIGGAASIAGVGSGKSLLGTTSKTPTQKPIF